MTNYTGTYIPECVDNNAYRAWGRAISDAFAALSPQITLVSTTADWGIVGAEGSTVQPAGSFVLAAYSVYRFNDTAQTTAPVAPVFFQVSFYSKSNTVGGLYPYISVHVGVTYSGSGPLTSVANLGVINYAPASGTSPTSTAREIAVSTDGSGVAFSLGMDGPVIQGSGVFIIDRFRDPDGVPLADGWAALNRGEANTATVATVDPVSGTATVAYTVAWPSIGLYSMNGVTSTLSVSPGLASTLFPVWAGNRFGTRTLKMAMGYTANDFSPTPGTISTTVLNAPRIYRRLGPLRSGFDITASVGALCSIWWSG